MWIAVYWARDRQTAEKIQHHLYSAGVLVKIQSMDRNKSENCFEILVEQNDVEKAHQIIIDEGF